jgi:hypothetical protein
MPVNALPNFSGSGLRIGSFRPCISKGFDRRAGRIDAGDLGKRVERHVKAPRVIDLRHQGHIRQARPVAKAERFPFHQAFDRAEAFLDLVPVPAIHGFLIVAQLAAKILQHA